MGCHAMQWNAMGCNGMLWDAMGCYGMRWDAMGCHRMPWDAMGCHAMPWDAMGCYGLPWDAAGRSPGLKSQHHPHPPNPLRVRPLPRYCPLPSRNGGPRGPFTMGCMYLTCAYPAAPPAAAARRPTSSSSSSSTAASGSILLHSAPADRAAVRGDPGSTAMPAQIPRKGPEGIGTPPSEISRCFMHPWVWEQQPQPEGSAYGTQTPSAQTPLLQQRVQCQLRANRLIRKGHLFWGA